MIKLSISKQSVDALNREIDLKVKAIGHMTQPDFLNEVSKAVFVILGERFVLAVDRFSVTNPKRMHHIYEWNKVGSPSARLFVLNKAILVSGSMTIKTEFKPSKTPVPINPELLSPGATGKVVSKRNVFRDKAQVMEEGRAVHYQAKKMLAFMGSDLGIKFIQPGTTVNINNPGGKYVKGSLATFMSAWYNKNAQTIIDSSGLYERIANETARVLSKNNAGIADVKAVTQQVVNSIVAGREIIK
jgi:hypothetical protein